MEARWPEDFHPEVVRAGFGRRFSSYAIALEAWRRRLKVEVYDSGFDRYRIFNAEQTLEFTRSRPETPAKAIKTASNKYRTNRALKTASVPVPEARIVATDASADKLNQIASELQLPIVVKPVHGTKGTGVQTGIENTEELQQSLQHLRADLGLGRAVIESQIEGEDYRILVIGDDVVAACHRVPANVRGDGRRTVSELIREKNTERRKNPYLAGGLIKKDREADDYMRRQGLTLDSVPANGQAIRLRGKANASAGGDTEDVTDDLPERIKSGAVEAVKALPGLNIAGVDILYDSAANQKGSYAVIELNTIPHIGVNMFPSSGVGQDVPDRHLNYFFPGSKRADDDKYRSLTYDFEGVLAPLRNGTASRVEIAALPSHGYPYRRLYRTRGIEMPSKSRRNRVEEWGRKLEVAGHIELFGTDTRIMLAGTHAKVQTLRARLEDLFSAELSDDSHWEGRVTQGLRFIS